MNKEKFYKIVLPYTMTSQSRIESLYDSLEYIRNNNIPGDMVECGVWKGGNILGILEYLDFYKMYDRSVWLYDTFAGLTKPTEKDFSTPNSKDNKMSNTDVIDYWKKNNESNDKNLWCFCDLDTVKKNLSPSNFPKDKIKYVVGDISETLKNEENSPTSISLLRLDTDWYESTKIEMEVLYPKLNTNGILIVDDYNCWNGSKEAVDEYFENRNIKPNIITIDKSAIKIDKQMDL